MSNMILIDRHTVQKALEAFDQLILVTTYNRPSVHTLNESEEAATALREALAIEAHHGIKGDA